MLKTIRGRIIVLQTLIIIAVIVGLFVVFSTFADNYYYSRKLQTIDRAYQELDKANIESLDKDNSVISNYENEKLTFIICNSSFQRVYVTKLEKKPIDAQAQIKNDIVKNMGNYSYTYRKDSDKNRIYGYGIINQYGEDFYVYIFENKETTKIFFSYYRIFFIILSIIILLVAIIISLYVSKKLSRPIEEIDRAASSAINSGYTLTVSEKQSFKETESLANSINNMLYQIRLQMTDLEDELVRKNQTENERRIFINNVSHELKTPLAVISSQIEMLKFIQDDEKRLEYIDSIEEETLKMTDMINDMIVMYATQSDESELSMEDVDLAELMRNTVDQYENLIDKNGIALSQEYDKNCIARVNKRYISQAVGNYITNAIKHCQENGVMKVRVIDDDTFVRIEVENDGDRIAEKYKDRIWESFFSRDDNITLNGQKSSGIGLAIVKSVMEVHNGEYGFVNLEEGVKFWMKIPKIFNDYKSN